MVSYLLKPVTNPGLHAAIEVAVARAREIQVLQENVDQLKMTLRERKLIERAKGILMSRRHLSENEAFRLLQTAKSGPSNPHGQACRIDHPDR